MTLEGTLKNELLSHTEFFVDKISINKELVWRFEWGVGRVWRSCNSACQVKAGRFPGAAANGDRPQNLEVCASKSVSQSKEVNSSYVRK